MRHRILNIILLLLITTYCYGQVTVSINSGNPKFPFPQFTPYESSNGHALENLGTELEPGLTHCEMEKYIGEAWQIFANSFQYTGQSYAGVDYIRGNIGCPYDCTEGEGYALLAAAEMGDKVIFDGLWFRTHDLRFQMYPRYSDCVIPNPAYRYGSNSLNDNGGDAATDGSMDIALAMVIAWKQWGDNSGYNDACGNPISYKKEALNLIRGLVEKGQSGDGVTPPGCNQYSGVIGFDGYFKGGNTFGELTSWAPTSNPTGNCPQYTGAVREAHIDYVAAGYFHCFAEFLTMEGGTAEDISWNIPQLRRAEASTACINGQLLPNPAALPTAGWAAVDASNNVTFSAFQEGEDFRHAWRSSMMPLWYGNPEYSWNPTTRQISNTPNSYEWDIQNRLSNFMENPGQAPWTNECINPGGGLGMSFMGPSQVQQMIDANNGNFTGTFPLNWMPGTGAGSAVIAQNFELMGKLYRQCVLEWDGTAGNLNSVPRYFHGFFRLLGMLTLTGNHHSPCENTPTANMKVYKSVDKTFAFSDDLITYTIDYRNYSSIDARNVVITDRLPDGLSFVSASNGGTQAGGIVTWNLGTVPGFKSNTGIPPTEGQLTLICRIEAGFSGRICNEVTIRSSNGPNSKSSLYPNNCTPVMEQNCVDVVEKALEIDKKANFTLVNPGTDVTFAIGFGNTSRGGFINGGRPGVNFAYAHNGTPTSGNTQGIKVRLFHGASEPYIDYQNYRISLFQNDGAFGCINGTAGCPIGWNFSNTIYEGGNPAGVRISTEAITPGSDSRGAWNQRVIIQFAEQYSATTPHLLRYFGLPRIREGGQQPLRAVWNMTTSTWGATQWNDDWSWNPTADDADGGFYHPVTDDWTDYNATVGTPVTTWHNESCETASNTVDNVLVEEWDGYTWRRVFGNGPLPGRDIDDVVVRDVLPLGYTFKGFVDENGVNLGASATYLGQTATYNSLTRTITWTTPKLLVGQTDTIRYVATANFTSGSCVRTDEVLTNTASIEGDNESATFVTEDVTITCETVVLPVLPSSMTKTTDLPNYTIGDEITYTLSYENTDGSIIDANVNSRTNWTLQSGSMNVGSTGITSVPNSPGVMTYNYSHGTNGSIEATIDFAANAAYGLAFRHTGGVVNNGMYIVFKPNPGGGSVDTRVFNGTTLFSSRTLTYAGNPVNIKLVLVDGQLQVWLGNTSNPTPSWTVNGIPVRAGYAGVIHGFADTGGDAWATNRVTNFETHLDSAFDLSFEDPIPNEIDFVNASNIPNAVEGFPNLFSILTLPDVNFNTGGGDADGGGRRRRRG